MKLKDVPAGKRFLHTIKIDPSTTLWTWYIITGENKGNCIASYIMRDNRVCEGYFPSSPIVDGDLLFRCIEPSDHISLDPNWDVYVPGLGSVVEQLLKD